MYICICSVQKKQNERDNNHEVHQRQFQQWENRMDHLIPK